ncbi:MAG: hypothetical protein B6U87_02685, partial [Candidatus Aenigmarchaeota archaeon ex4484_52]
KTKNLQEGDVIAEKIKKLNINGKRYEGISKEDILKIRKIKKYIYIKDGVRYAPTFFFTIVFFVI